MTEDEVSWNVGPMEQEVSLILTPQIHSSILFFLDLFIKTA